MLKKSAWLVHLTSDKAPPAAHESSEVARTENRRCYHPHTGSGWHNWCLSSILSSLVRFSTQDAATGGSLPCGSYFLASLTGNKERSKGHMVLRVKPTPTRFPTNSLYTPMGNTPLHSVPQCVPLVGLWLACVRGEVDSCITLLLLDPK